jgi:hypothetical protein
MPEMVRLEGKIEEGLMPREVIFRVEDAEGGIEEIPVSQRSIQEGKLIAYTVGRDLEGRVLVELPRESVSGRWRMWVKASAVGV